MKALLVLSSLLLLSSNVFAAKQGQDKGNGGDSCESHFNTIRDDIASWIKKGGHRHLKLPEGVYANDYETSMLEAIQNAKVQCISKAIKIDGLDKICRNFIDQSGVKQIECNREAFLELTKRETETYRLVHHEYAGFAGLETTVNGESHYEISNQISAYLEDQVIKRLAVKTINKTDEEDTTQDPLPVGSLIQIFPNISFGQYSADMYEWQNAHFYNGKYFNSKDLESTDVYNPKKDDIAMTITVRPPQGSKIQEGSSFKIGRNRLVRIITSNDYGLSGIDIQGNQFSISCYTPYASVVTSSRFSFNRVACSREALTARAEGYLQVIDE